MIETLDFRRHGLQTGDSVLLREIQGMEKLNECTFEITYRSPSSFTVNGLDTTQDSYPQYTHGGLVKRVKQSVTIEFHSLEKQLKAPDLVVNDLSKLEAPLVNLIALSTLYRDASAMESYCKDSNLFVSDCQKLNKEISCGIDELDIDSLKSLIRTCRGKLAPLCAAVGGIGAQEVLKGLSGKFMPLKQWLMIDAVEVATQRGDEVSSDTDERYYSLLHSIGEELLAMLKTTKLFMVGCGAIGCEMLKNYALLGVGGNGEANGGVGGITITDNDLIEKSNLNRQFLFRPWHIQVNCFYKRPTLNFSQNISNPTAKLQKRYSGGVYLCVCMNADSIKTHSSLRFVSDTVRSLSHRNIVNTFFYIRTLKLKDVLSFFQF